MSSTNPHTRLPYSGYFYQLLDERKRLPVYNYRDQFMNLLSHNQCIVVVGETGSGKSTQIPQWCMDYALKMTPNLVACTQPRQAAAKTVAQRVAEEVDVKLGETVGYEVRFDNKCNEMTRLKYMTDGILLCESTRDVNFSKYKIIIIDEAHERTVAIDNILASLKYTLNTRQDLKIIIMSASLNAEQFTKYFNNAPLLRIPGKTYSVNICHLKLPTEDYVQKVVDMVVDIHMKFPKGDVLVFLTGEEEITVAKRAIEEKMMNFEGANKFGFLECLPFYSSLSLKEQQKIFQSSPQIGKGRRIILSTNIAETSLTINGIIFVIDCGYVKQKIYNSVDRSESLVKQCISQACALQRAGRAGRTQPGTCYRLYTTQEYEKMPKNTTAEIHRVNLESTVLRWKKIKSDCDVGSINFIEPLDPDKLRTALQSLIDFNALDKQLVLTKHGLNMAKFTVEPHFANAIIASIKYNCLNEIIKIIAMLTVPDCFCRTEDKQAEAYEMKKIFIDKDSDFTTLLNVYNEFNKIPEGSQQEEWCEKHFIKSSSVKMASKVYKQLHSVVVNSLKLKNEMSTDRDASIETRIKKSLLHAYFMNLGFANEGKDTFSLVQAGNNFKLIHLHASCCSTGKSAKWIIFNECLSAERKYYFKTITPIDPRWLSDIAPQYFRRLFDQDENNYCNQTSIKQLKTILQQTSWYDY